VPYWNVAIGYVENGRTEIGLVYDPSADALYHALRGTGAWCTTPDGQARLHAAGTQELAGSYVALGHHDRAFEPRYFGNRAPHDGSLRCHAQLRLGRAAALRNGRRRPTARQGSSS
jgi:fructose-1,6-bisphosphatase/inositol monophosphatase family enzyme